MNWSKFCISSAYSLKCYECMPTSDGSPCKQTEKDCLPIQQCSSLSVGTSMGMVLCLFLLFFYLCYLYIVIYFEFRGTVTVNNYISVYSGHGTECQNENLCCGWTVSPGLSQFRSQPSDVCQQVLQLWSLQHCGCWRWAFIFIYSYHPEQNVVLNVILGKLFRWESGCTR